MKRYILYISILVLTLSSIYYYKTIPDRYYQTIQIGITEDQLLQELEHENIKYESITNPDSAIHSFNSGLTWYSIYIENKKVISKGRD